MSKKVIGGVPVENKYNVSYTLQNDLKSLGTLLWIPLKEFDEGEPIYTEAEADEIVKFIHSYEVPQFDKNLTGWEEFRHKLNREIYNIYGK